MKNIFTALIIIVFSLSGLVARGQGNLDFANLVVKDSTGAVYQQEAWLKLLSSGQYMLRIAQDKKTATLVRKTAEYDRQIPQTGSSIKLPESPFFQTGTKIASFNERDMNWERFNLKEMGGKVVVINFWFINCPPCRQEIPDLNELVENYKDNKDVVFIGIALDEKYELVDFLKETPFNYHIIPNGRFTAGKYGINSYPTNVVLDKESKVVFHTTGGLNSRSVGIVKAAIDKALKGGSTQ